MQEGHIHFPLFSFYWFHLETEFMHPTLASNSSTSGDPRHTAYWVLKTNPGLCAVMQALSYILSLTILFSKPQNPAENQSAAGMDSAISLSCSCLTNVKGKWQAGIRSGKDLWTVKNMLISLVRCTVEFVEAKIPETSTSDRTIHKNLPIAFSFLWAQGLKALDLLCSKNGGLKLLILLLGWPSPRVTMPNYEAPRDWTQDSVHPRQALYQLSYVPRHPFFLYAKQMAYTEFWFCCSVCPSFSSWLPHHSSGCWKDSPYCTHPCCSNWKGGEKGCNSHTSTDNSVDYKTHQHVLPRQNKTIKSSLKKRTRAHTAVVLNLSSAGTF